MSISLEKLRTYAIARSMFKPTTLGRAIEKLGFVQADPIRAPARAQDLVLRHRVRDYAAGTLERRYPRLDIEEDFFVNYGFLPRAHHDLMHPRVARLKWTPARARNAREVLEFIRENGAVHPRQVDEHFAHGKMVNWFGGSSNASTHLLDDMHYRGLLRVARREAGTRVYAVREAAAGAVDPALARARFDALVDVAMQTYAPLPAASLGRLLSLLCNGIPQWRSQRAAALSRARARFAHARVDGTDWYWPAQESPQSARWRTDAAVRLLAPFDPVVWDRRRFAMFWGWDYRFEAYTPAPKRKLGYYALPLLWGHDVIGWGNLQVQDGRLLHRLGYTSGRAPDAPAFARALDEELARIGRFLGCTA